MANSIDYSSLGDIEKKLNSAKQSLSSLNENIRRFVGRGPKDSRCVIEKNGPDGDGKKNEQNLERSVQRQSLKPKRRTHDSSSLLNRIIKSDKDESWSSNTPRVNSRVIRELPSREEIVEAQGVDSESRARNRRMFGSLLGTLQKFCQEESRLKKKEDKKAQIEKKLEKQEMQEREMFKKERESLFLHRKRKQLEIKCLEKKMARLKDFKIWESSMIFQKRQIRTKTKPHIFFQPRIYNPQMEKLLSKSKFELHGIIEKRREVLQTELMDIESTENIDEECTLDESSIYEKYLDYEEHRIDNSNSKTC
ncbi:Pnn, partial [Drosophila busckii]